MMVPTKAPSAQNGRVVAETANQNEILSKLSATDLALVLEDAEELSYEAREHIFSEKDQIGRVFFPLTGLISVVVVLSDGTTIEAMTAGREGFIGIPLLHDVRTARFTAVCQVEGNFLALKTDAFLAVIKAAPDLERRLHRYSQFSTEVISQSAACNSVHSIEQRCARWLLITADAIGRTSFNLTQEFLAQMLAVRRPGVTVAIGALARQGLLSHSYGKITLLDVESLKLTSCECYSTIKGKAQDLLS